MNLYPRSLMRMLVIGNIVVMLPLVAAVGYAAMTVDDLTRHSETVVHETASVAASGRDMRQDLAHMTRLIRQFETLRDPSLLLQYDAVRSDWRRDTEDYSALPLLDGLHHDIAAIRDREEAAHRKLGANAEGLADLLAVLGDISRGVDNVQQEANRRLDAEQQTYRHRADTLWQRLMIAMLCAITLTAVLLWLGRRAIARMWSRFDRAVRSIGDGQFDRRIRLKGPDDLQRLGRRLEWLRSRMQSLESERTRFMRHASHELRTPLAALREGVNLLDEGVAGPLTPQQSRIAGIMKSNAVRLQSLIESLLHLQKANHANDARADGEPNDGDGSGVHFDQIVSHTLETCRLAARQRHLHIEESLAPLIVKGDTEAIATVAGNLISNAVKFSPDGGTIRVLLASNDGQAQLDVIDEGPGIDFEEHGRLFSPFFRGAAGKFAPGTGLGLAIAREFAQACGGTIVHVPPSTEHPRGAHFRARIPLLPPPRSPDTTLAGSAMPPLGSR